MELKKMRCENCGSVLDMADGVLFCSYCGEKLILDDGSKNINIIYKDEVRIKEVEAKIKESEINERIRIKELEKEEHENKAGNKIAFHLIAFLFLMMFIMFFFFGGGLAKCQGKISAGYCDSYVGKNYKIVVKEFEARGFENIETIDLDDAGLLWNKEGTVESVSVAGNSNFDSDKYFYPTDKVIISYH